MSNTQFTETKEKVSLANKNVPRADSSSVQVETNIHSSCYNDFFLLRTPISINNRPVVIEVINSEPVLRVSDVSIPLSAILQQVVAPVVSKHGVCQVDSFYHEEVALFSINFRSILSLKHFLTDKEAVQEELASAISNLFHEEAAKRLSKQSDSKSTSQSSAVERIKNNMDVDLLAVVDEAKVYLVSPAVGHPPLVQQINLANHLAMFNAWKRSKVFDFSSTMFTSTGTIDSPKAWGDECAELADLQSELKEVIAWFELGVQLKIPTCDLLAIREDFKTVKKCRLEMLFTWEQLEKPTWKKLCLALVHIGMKYLAGHLAEKYNIIGLQRPTVTQAGATEDSSASSKLMESEHQLSMKTKELNQAKQLRNLASQKLEKEVSEEVPLLQRRVKSLTDETKHLTMQLEHRNEEIKMLERMKLSDKHEVQLLERLLEEKREQISSLKDELTKKETELDDAKGQLKNKEVELAAKIEELSSKCDQVFKLETDVEKLKRSFDEQQEEINKKSIEAVAASVSHEKYLKQVEIQRDIAMEEASKNKADIQAYSQKLLVKEEQISRLSEKIAEQEQKMTKLREELDSVTHHHTTEQLPTEQMREYDEKEQQLLTLHTSIIQLKLEQKKIEYAKNQENVNLERMKWFLSKHEQEIAQTNLSHTALLKQNGVGTIKAKTNIPPSETQGNVRTNTGHQEETILISNEPVAQMAVSTNLSSTVPVEQELTDLKVQTSSEGNKEHEVKEAGKWTSRIKESISNNVGDLNRSLQNAASTGTPLSPNGVVESGDCSAVTIKEETILVNSEKPVLIDSTALAKTDGPPIPSSVSSFVTVDGEDSRKTSQLTAVNLTHSCTTAGSVEPALKAVASEGLYPMIIEPPDGGYWVENGDYVSALGEDGIWRAPEINTEHYTIQTDPIANIYGRLFVGQEHTNYIASDITAGPALLSLKFEEDQHEVQARALFRTNSKTVYKITPLPKRMKPEDYFKYISKQHGEEMNVTNAVEITSSQSVKLIQSFDEHTVNKMHEFGVIYQKRHQNSEEELFTSTDHSDALEEFLSILGEKIMLEDHDESETGDYSFYTEYKDREITFHVSTQQFPHDTDDMQHEKKKSLIGNTIVVIVFQEKNAQFCPNVFSSHLVHAYIVVQVEHPNTDHTVYKVSVAAKNEVTNFGPPIPYPTIFRKGSDFKDWLFTKALNAEFNCLKTSTFLKQANHTREEHFKDLVVKLSTTFDDSEVDSNDGSSQTHEKKKNRFSTLLSKVSLPNRSSSFSFHRRSPIAERQTRAQTMSKHRRSEFYSTSKNDSPGLKKKPFDTRVDAQLASLPPQQRQDIIQTPLLEPKLPLKLKWTQGSEIPFEMDNGPSAVVMKGDVYFGGASASSDKNEQIVCVYNLHKDSWSQLDPPYEHKYFRLAVINDNQLVAVAGTDVRTGKKTNTLAVWDDEKCQWMFSLPAMNIACNSPAVTTYNQWLLVAGGYGDQGYLSRVEVMSVLSNQWYQVASSLPVAGSHMSSAILGNMWYVMSGNTSDGTGKSVMSVCVENIILEATSKSSGRKSSTLSRWNCLPDTPLKTPTALVYQGALLAVGGIEGFSSPSSAMYIYQPSTSKWIKACDMPTNRNMAGSTVLPDGQIMIAGGFGANNQVDIAQ